MLQNSHIEAFNKGDFVLYQGESVAKQDKFFFILSGAVQYLKDNEDKMEQLTEHLLSEKNSVANQVKETYERIRVHAEEDTHLGDKGPYTNKSTTSRKSPEAQHTRQSNL